MRARRPLLARLLAALLALAFVAAACSDDGGETATAAPDEGASETTSTTAADDGDPFPGTTWETRTPEEVGLDPARLEELNTYLEGTDSNCVAVIKDGYLVDERYWHETDGETNQEIFSASKSTTSTLVGIAEEQGYLDIEQPASDFITEWQGTPSEDVTIKNLLSNDSGRYYDVETDYMRMAAGSPDRTEFAISLDQQHPPGEHWEYNNSAIQTLEAVIERSTGQDMEEFAQANLLEPIGMSSSISRDQAGNPAAFMGVQAGCLDMARFGYLFLQEGNWDGEQVVPAEWVAEATGAPSQDLNSAYGYLWWRNADGGWILPAVGGLSDGVFWEGAPLDAYAALGLGNQIILVLPSENMVVARAGPTGRNDSAANQSTSVGRVAELVVAAQG
jgi:CubicO group peptidase (beta-lactamase class C family)